MKKQAVLSVMLIFLFAFLLLCAGLTVTEKALQKVTGLPGGAEAISLWQDHSGVWVFTFAGRSVRFDDRLWQVFLLDTGR